MSLKDKKCLPCEGGVEAFTPEKISEYLKLVHENWKLENGKIVSDFKFKDFVEAMKFVNSVAEIAESEGHHPDIIVRYNKVRLELYTHAIDGLSENDFILAAKIG
jgi:4a-hydroxytetrahydrobiopterin dehydratase